MRWFGLFLAVVGGLLSFFMASKMWMQHAMISTAVPVDAMVNESRVEEFRGSKGRKRYRPLVAFTYVMDGQTYESRRITALDMSRGGRRNANEIVGKFPAGVPAKVMVSRDFPSKGFLDATYLDTPYTLLMVGVSVLAIGVGVFMLSERKRDPAPVDGATPALWLLPVGVSLTTRWMTMLVGGVVWLVVLLAVGGHYVAMVGFSNAQVAFDIFASLCITLAFAAIARGVWVLFISRIFDEPRVMIDAIRPIRGQKLLVVVEQSAKRHAAIDAMDVTLVCTESITTGRGKSKRVKTREAWSELHSVLENAQQDASGDRTVVRGAAWFEPPTSTMPTSAPGEWEMRYDWKLRLRSHAKGPDYQAVWTVVVE